MEKAGPTSPLSVLIHKNFEGCRFQIDHLKIAGRKLAREGEAAAIEYLLDKKCEGLPPNFQPPAKGNVIAQSRPFTEWAPYRASVAIQKYIYSLSVDERKVCDPGSSSDSHEKWFKQTGVQNYGYTHVQGLNLIFKHALARYDGVLKKVDNRNEKNRKKAERVNSFRREEGLPEEVFEEEKATDETGHLLQPPGVNHSIYCYQSVRPKPFNPRKPGGISLPEAYSGYSLKPQDELPIGSLDRLSIPPGQPGYVPEWQRSQLTTQKHRRKRSWYSAQKWKPRTGRTSTFDPDRLNCARAQGAILAVVRIHEDWVVFDVRGLLRNALWRELAGKGLTVRDLLDFFTGDPVVDTKRGVVTFTYKLGKVDVHSLRTVRGKRSKKVLEDLTLSSDVGLVTIDLGQTNVLAADYSKVTRSENGELLAVPLSKSFLPKHLLHEVTAYRTSYDQMEEGFRRKALLTLTEDQQVEVTLVRDFSVESSKTKLLQLGVDVTSLPWEKMSSNTTYISDQLLQQGADPASLFFDGERDGKPCRHKKKDRTWAYLVRPKVSPETRKALNEALWALKNTSPEFESLSKRKIQFSRRCMNYLLNEAKRISGCGQVVFVIEDLNVRVHHGRGKRAIGWDNFFKPKRENRWFMQALHKAASELAIHRGMHIIEACPARSSITCPKCGHCDPENRCSSDREKFLCVKCGAAFHADLEVATFNLRKVALTGTALPKSIDHSRDGLIPKGARNRKLKEPQANDEKACA
jgi:hypothetical protein